jgi:NAD(P)-dependent dehydrogenase (short-subunit alcohol dehydrogenase family)
VDLTDRQRVEHLVTACLERFTSVHALVHCAGIAQEALLSTLDDATIDQLIAVHVTSTIALARAVIRPMLLQRQGRIVLLSSVAAHQPSQGATVYAGCKAFIEGFVRALAVEVGRKGITVNAVAPGMVDTNMLSPTRTLVGSRLAERAAAKRFAAPDEVAAAIEYLCGSDSAYVNGHVLAVDGAYLGPP